MAPVPPVAPITPVTAVTPVAAVAPVPAGVTIDPSPVADGALVAAVPLASSPPADGVVVPPTEGQSQTVQSQDQELANLCHLPGCDAKGRTCLDFVVRPQISRGLCLGMAPVRQQVRDPVPFQMWRACGSPTCVSCLFIIAYFYFILLSGHCCSFPKLPIRNYGKFFI